MVSDLAQAGEGSTYISTGKKIGEDPIRLDKGSYKGKLFYEAEFVPAMYVKKIDFSSGPNAIERAADACSEYSVGDNVSDSSSDFEIQAVPEGVTASAPLGDEESLPPKSPTSRSHKSRKSTDTTATFESKSTMLSVQSKKTTQTGATTDEKVSEPEVPELSKEELLTHRT